MLDRFEENPNISYENDTLETPTPHSAAQKRGREEEEELPPTKIPKVENSKKSSFKDSRKSLKEKNEKLKSELMLSNNKLASSTKIINQLLIENQGLKLTTADVVQQLSDNSFYLNAAEEENFYLKNFIARLEAGHHTLLSALQNRNEELQATNEEFEKFKQATSERLQQASYVNNSLKSELERVRLQSVAHIDSLKTQLTFEKKKSENPFVQSEKTLSAQDAERSSYKLQIQVQTQKIYELENMLRSRGIPLNYSPQMFGAVPATPPTPLSTGQSPLGTSGRAGYTPEQKLKW